MKKKCYIYTRVSTAAQTEGYSLEAQQERLRQYANIRTLKLRANTVTPEKRGRASWEGLPLWR